MSVSARLAAAALLFLGGAAHADCDDPSTATLQGHLDGAEAAYRGLDLEGFRAAMDRAAVAVPCISTPFPPDLAARYHRLQGLRAAVLRDEAREKQAFLAARRADPAYVLPEDLVPAAHPVRRAYGALPLDAGGTEALPPPAEGRLWMDGRTAEGRPTEAPVVLQHLDTQGRADLTRYLWPGDPLPAYAQALPEAPPAARSGPRKGLLWSGVAGVVVGGALYGAGALTARQYWAADDPSRLDGLRGTTHALGAAGISVGVAGLALGVAGLAGGGD